MAITQWWLVSRDSKWVWIASGDITTTVKQSIDATDVKGGINSQGVEYDGTNWFLTEDKYDYVIYASGELTSTVKSSQDVSTLESYAAAISEDQTHTYLEGTSSTKYYKLSGKITTTVKSSGSYGEKKNSGDISTLETNFLRQGVDTDADLYVMSGHLTSTHKDSLEISSWEAEPKGVTKHGSNYGLLGTEADKLYIMSGGLSSTLKDSTLISGITTSVAGGCHNDVNDRLGLGGGTETERTATPAGAGTAEVQYEQEDERTATLSGEGSVLASGFVLDERSSGLSGEGACEALYSLEYERTAGLVGEGECAAIGEVSEEDAIRGADPTGTFSCLIEYTLEVTTSADPAGAGSLLVSYSVVAPETERTADLTGQGICEATRELVYPEFERTADTSGAGSAAVVYNCEEERGVTPAGVGSMAVEYSTAGDFLRTATMTIAGSLETGHAVFQGSEEFALFSDDSWHRIVRVSGYVSTTIRDSLPTLSNFSEDAPSDLEFDSAGNVSFAGDDTDKLYLLSGLLSTTVKASHSTSLIDVMPSGVSYNNENSPWVGRQYNKLYLQSGQFNSTIKDSAYIGWASDPTGVSSDSIGVTYITDGIQDSDNRLVWSSGHVTTTIKDSLTVSGVERIPRGVAWDGSNTSWAGLVGVDNKDRWYLTSGHFSNTLKNSVELSSRIGDVSGVATSHADARMDVAAERPVAMSGEASLAGVYQVDDESIRSIAASGVGACAAAYAIVQEESRSTEARGEGILAFTFEREGGVEWRSAGTTITSALSVYYEIAGDAYRFAQPTGYASLAVEYATETQHQAALSASSSLNVVYTTWPIPPPYGSRDLPITGGGRVTGGGDLWPWTGKYYEDKPPPPPPPRSKAEIIREALKEVRKPDLPLSRRMRQYENLYDQFGRLLIEEREAQIRRNQQDLQRWDDWKLLGVAKATLENQQEVSLETGESVPAPVLSAPPETTYEPVVQEAKPEDPFGWVPNQYKWILDGLKKQKRFQELSLAKQKRLLRALIEMAENGAPPNITAFIRKNTDLRLRA